MHVDTSQKSGLVPDAPPTEERDSPPSGFAIRTRPHGPPPVRERVFDGAMATRRLPSRVPSQASLNRTSRDQLRVVVLDDSELVRAGLRTALAPLGIAVVGEAADPADAVALVRQLAPAAVTTELSLESGSGIEAMRHLSVVAPTSPVMVLTDSTEHEDLTGAVMAGARGYMLKDARTEAIAGALRAVAAGHSVVSSRIAGHLFHGVRSGSLDPEPCDWGVDPRTRLTERELEILKLLASGRENAQIAGLLNLSPSTVKNHISSILAKLGLENRIQAAVFAVRHGVV